MANYLMKKKCANVLNKMTLHFYVSPIKPSELVEVIFPITDEVERKLGNPYFLWLDV